METLPWQLFNPVGPRLLPKSRAHRVTHVSGLDRVLTVGPNGLETIDLRLPRCA